jgi:Flagellar biosynthesis protein, FliO
MPDLQPYLTYIYIAAGIIAALLVLWILMRMFRGRTRGREGLRLGISEYHELDQTRRLVLVRRDSVEHLILIGGPQDVVIESGIDLGLKDPLSHNYQGDSNNDVVPMRPIRPAVFGTRKPTLRPFAVPNPEDQEPA